jgi:hypothetical protein
MGSREMLLKAATIVGILIVAVVHLMEERCVAKTGALQWANIILEDY